MNLFLDTESDANLYRLLKAGDKQAFDKIFQKYFLALTTFARQWVSSESAKDTVQEIFLWIWEHRRDLSINSKLSTYLFVAVKNRCINLIVRGQVEQQIKSDLVKSLYEEISTEYVDFTTLWDRLSRVLETIPDSYREVFVMHRLNGMSYKEISQIKGVSVKTIDYRMCNALKRLREKLKDVISE